MPNPEEIQDIEEIRKERREQYLFEEKNIFDSLLSNNVELNRTMRYFSGAILILMTAYIDWKTVNNSKYMLYSYAPFVLSIISNIISYVFVRDSLYKQSKFNADYYLRNIETARTQYSKSGTVGGILIYFSILSFIIGILVFSVFLFRGILKLKGG
ncbi:hypothetical protein C6497_00685 [Candidatus Poribacteria bacterium]|nr:MAG: hypothetical protein C6497_00685 [Candidatus Poribacteria bacterium]